MKNIGSLVLILLLLVTYGYTINNKQQSVTAFEQNGALYNVTMKQDILCLMLAYPEHIENVEQVDGRVYIVMKSGKKILYDDKKSKSIDSKIAYPDLQDMLEQAYPIGSVKTLMDVNHDPGRARVYSLLNEVYGASQKQIENNLINAKAGNRSFQFNKNNRAAEALENVMRELVILAEKRPDIRTHVFPCNGTYSYRIISGTNRLSAHSYGTAIDLAVNKNDYWRWTSREEGQKRLSSYQVEIIAVFEKNNFIWGGKWGHFDIMHFEYRPELLIKARYFGSIKGSNQLWYEGVPTEDEYVKNCIEKIDKVI